MDQHETAREELTRTLTSLGLDIAKIRVGPDGTIVHEAIDRQPPIRPLPDLPPLVSATDATLRHIEVGEPLGEGGMGVVSEATQIPLDRHVAVKVPRAKGTRAGTRSAAHSLLREAYVQGALAHPNVVPVYMLGSGPDAQPMLVMKRIEGTEWADLLAGEREIPGADTDRDPLAWHLGVLMQVCNAVHFAHSKGIVHRDVKPNNVMIGDYGEVYLVDWGLAVRFGEAAEGIDPDDPDRLPPAASIDTVCGTPEFMAPEMARADGSQIGPATDVYQLGACLHLIVTGQARHRGDEPLQKMASAFLSEPFDYDDGVPPLLAQICNKAMARTPADRHASVEELRRDLAGFLRHRHAEQLTREGDVRLEELRALLDRTAEPSPLDAYNLLSEARFAYRQALREWPESAAARRGLQDSLELMASHELDHRAFNAAALLIAELPVPNQALESRSARLRAELDAEHERRAGHERVAQEVDVRVGIRERSRIVLMIGVFFPVLYGTLGALARSERFTAGYGTFIAIGLVYGGLLAVMSALARKVLRRSKVNQRFIGGLWAVFLAQAMLWPIAWVADVPFPRALSLLMLVYFLVVLTLAIGLEFRMMLSACPLGLGALIAMRWPHLGYDLLGVALFGACAVTALFWRWDQRRDRKSSRAQ